MATKKPKASKEVKKAYASLVNKVMCSPNILLKKQNANNKLYELRKATERINDLKTQYEIIVKSPGINESLADDMPISSLKDSLEYELKGKVSKLQFEDIIRASEIKREGQNIINEKFNITSESIIAEIDLLQATIEELLKISDD